MTSANLLIVILVGAVVGALVGLALGGALTGFYLAVVAGFLATVIAGVARNEIMKRAGAGPDDSKIPNLVLIYSAVASLGGSSLADEVVRISGLDSAVWLGMLAGLFSCILLAMLLITYYLNPETGRYYKSR
jgi:polyferredoxin